MAFAAASRGTQTMNSMYFKPMLRKVYHRKSGSPEMVITDTVKLNGEEVRNKTGGAAVVAAGNCDTTWWIPDERTGIFYPKGQERVIQDVPDQGTSGKEIGSINWFD